MSLKPGRLIALAASLLALAAAAPAADLTKAPSFRSRQAEPAITGLKHWALLIGITKYDDRAGMDDLRFPAADVQGLRDVLVDPARGVYHPTAVTVITDGGKEDAKVTQGRLLLEVQQFVDRARQYEADSVLFFFSGHGMAADGEAYLLAADSLTTSADNIRRTALGYAEIEHLLASTGARQQVAVLDACRNIRPRDSGTKGASVERASEWLSAVSSIGSGNGTVRITAANQGQVAYEDEACGHGLFACKLIAALRGAADGSTGAPDGRVDLREMFNYVRTSVVQRAEELRGQAADGSMLTPQIPQMVGDFDGEFILSSVPWGILEITATPWAAVRIFGPTGAIALEEAGIEPFTPLRLRINEGTYRVAFEYAGAKEERTVTVKGAEPTTVAWNAAASASRAPR